MYLGLGVLVCEYISWDNTASAVQFKETTDGAIQSKLFGGVKQVARKLGLGNRKKALSVSSVDGKRSPAVAETVVKVPSRVPDVYFTFSDVSYIVDVDVSDTNPDGKLKLLTSVNGYATPGMMIALMGTSGAGKTTLLDVLARRKTAGTITGDVLVNGLPQDDSFSRICGYVEQTDNHFTRETIREAFTFAALLRREPGESRAEIQRVVADVITQLGLDGLADALIGDSAHGLPGVSAEALKRITIGVELVADPAVVFMDEPTSGLDTKGALTVANVCRNIADSGKTVICTIHQPSQLVLETFDSLLLLQRGGRTVYFGDVGPSSKALTDYFAAGGAAPCPRNANPAEYMLEVVAPTTGGAATVDWTADRWDKSQQKAAALAALADNAKALVPAGAPPVTFESNMAASASLQFWLLLNRGSRTIWRDPISVLSLIGVACFSSGLTTLMFNGRCGDSVEGARYTVTCVFALFIQAPIFFMYVCLPNVYSSRPAFYRESSAGFYSARLYGLSQVLSWIPYLIFSSTVTLAIVYFGVPLREGGFFFAWCSFNIFMIGAWCIGLTVAASTSSFAAGSNAVTAPVLISLFFCGFMVSRDELGWWYRWLYYFNPAGVTYLMQVRDGSILRTRRWDWPS